MRTAPTWSDCTRAEVPGRPPGRQTARASRSACIIDPLAPVNYDICSVNADGSALARLTDAPGSNDPDWSTRGSTILFTDGTNGEHLVVMNADGSNATLVNHSGLAEQPRWSPDGTRIAYVSLFWVEFGDPTPSRFVTIMNADGTGVVNLGWGDSPVWRPSVGGVNYRPVASYSFQCDGPTCTLDGSASSDSDGTIVEYGWRFPDGTIATGVTVTHTFTSLTRWVSLTVMDDDAALARMVRPSISRRSRPSRHTASAAPARSMARLPPGSRREPLVFQLEFRRWRKPIGDDGESLVPGRRDVHGHTDRDRLWLCHR